MCVIGLKGFSHSLHRVAPSYLFTGHRACVLFATMKKFSCNMFGATGTLLLNRDGIVPNQFGPIPPGMTGIVCGPQSIVSGKGKGRDGPFDKGCRTLIKGGEATGLELGLPDYTPSGSVDEDSQIFPWDGTQLDSQEEDGSVLEVG